MWKLATKHVHVDLVCPWKLVLVPSSGLEWWFSIQNNWQCFHVQIESKTIRKYQGINFISQLLHHIVRQSIVMSSTSTVDSPPSLGGSVWESHPNHSRCLKSASHLQHLPHQLIHGSACPAYHLSTSELVTSFVLFWLGDCSGRRSNFQELYCNSIYFWADRMGKKDVYVIISV